MGSVVQLEPQVTHMAPEAFRAGEGKIRNCRCQHNEFYLGLECVNRECLPAAPTQSKIIPEFSKNFIL
jgi:hypothetical protein